ncbi:EAL domain-containing protein [Paenibacillus caui]|uniref:EAL domain-containing protein n=1 Tax=Paenibacillus caui TaxID=2873927 RepID=UPI001CA8F8D5|nr:EAL domain-containing protein [Paenibacillus caui]
MEHMHGSFDIELVLFSYGVAVMASYTVLNLVDRLSHTRGWLRSLWLLFGALAMGLGIWSMHFVGMLAFSLPMEVEYDLTEILISMFAAIAASAVAMHIVGRERMTFWQWLGGGLLLALGVIAMHYIGMSAMLVGITYDYRLVFLSVIIAVVAALAALALSFYFKKEDAKRMGWKKLGSGFVMGAAIAGMHYTGMWGASFYASSENFSSGIVLQQRWLAYLIIAVTIATLTLSLFSMFISRRFERQQSKLLENEKMFRSLYENNQDGIITVDLKQRIIGINGAAALIFEVNRTLFYHRQLHSLVAETDDFNNISSIFEHLSMERKSYETRIKLHTGKNLDIHLMTVPLEVEGKLIGHYIIIRDITAEMQAKEQIHYLAFHDELTGLDNRRKFNQQLEEMIQSHGSTGRRFAIMIMDMDRFKMINDSLGHIYGDLFLREMSERIRQFTRDYPVSLARIGGDEITVLYNNCNEKEAAELAERLIRNIHRPFRLKDNNFFVTASVGIAMYPDHGEDSVKLLKHADAAMYEVKKNGKNGYQFFSSQLDEQLQEKVELESDLRKALQNQQFLLYYQPQIRAEDHVMIGVEALVRWNHPVKGIISPAQFIPVAEELGVIIELGNWVLREACSQMKRWHKAGGPLIPVSVNLSSQQFHQHNLAGLISDILTETGLDPKYLELEITESMMMDPSASISILQHLTKLGIRISLDDFGTGYSSLSYLKQLPIHKLKIDRSFIRDIVNSDSDKAIVSTIISMARHLDMEVIAEGIETKEQLDVVTDTDCREIQGYYYSKPLSAVDVENVFFIPQRDNGGEFDTN